MTAKPAYRKDPHADDPATSGKFGDHVTADHVVAYNDSSTALGGQSVGLYIQDLASGHQAFMAQRTKGAKETAKNLRDWIGPWQKVRFIYTDGSPELNKACADLEWYHGVSTRAARE